MATAKGNRVRVASTTMGLTTFTLDSTAISGHQMPAAAGIPDGSQVSYVAEDASRTQWEVGRGSWDETTRTITRDEITDSSTGGTKVDFLTNPEVYIDIIVQDLDDMMDEANNYATAMAIALGG